MQNVYIFVIIYKRQKDLLKKMHDVVLLSRMTRVKLKPQDLKITNNS